MKKLKSKSPGHSDDSTFQAGCRKKKASFPGRVITESRIVRVGLYNTVNPPNTFVLITIQEEADPFLPSLGTAAFSDQRALTEKCVDRRKQGHRVR